MKKLIKITIPTLLLIIILTIYISNRIINVYGQSATYTEVSAIPYNKVGLLLGTSPKLRNGNPNLYFSYRIEAATALYNAGKIKYILVSGDNRRDDYNEPEEMKQALMTARIPEEHIILDYAGLRTLDSVIRANRIFGLDRFTIISQGFHNERAIYIAQQNHLHVVGYNAKDVSAYAGFKTNIRELLARVKVFVDILTDKSPRHIGETVRIPE